jgi:hypothetical protein
MSSPLWARLDEHVIALQTQSPDHLVALELLDMWRFVVHIARGPQRVQNLRPFLAQTAQDRRMRVMLSHPMIIGWLAHTSLDELVPPPIGRRGPPSGLWQPVPLQGSPRVLAHASAVSNPVVNHNMTYKEGPCDKWYRKAEPTVADCLALVRRHLWEARFLMNSAVEAEYVQFPRKALDLLINGLSLAA